MGLRQRLCKDCEYIILYEGQLEYAKCGHKSCLDKISMAPWMYCFIERELGVGIFGGCGSFGWHFKRKIDNK